MEMDLGGLLRALRRHMALLLLAAVFGAAVSLVGTFLLVTPQYPSTVTLYVNETKSAKDLADSFEVIVKMRESLMEVIREAQLNTNHGQLQKQIEVTQMLETDFFHVTVSGHDPYEAQRIAAAIGQILPGQVARIMEGTTVKVVGEAIAAARPSSPNYPNNALLGAALGLLLGLGAVLWKEWKKILVCGGSGAQ